MISEFQKLVFDEFIESTMGITTPDSWENIKMGYALNEVTKSAPSENTTQLTPSVVHGVVPQEELESNPQKALREDYELTLAEPGDFVVTMSSYEYGLEYCDIAGGISPDYTVLRPTVTDDQARFLRYLFKSKPFIELISLLSSGIRQGKRIYWSDLRDTEITVPSSDSAGLIVSYLDNIIQALDNVTNKRKEMLSQLDDKRGVEIFNQTFGKRTGDIFKETKTAWAPQIPSHWSETQLKYISNEIIDCEHKTAPNNENGEYHIIKTSDVRDGDLLLENSERAIKGVYEEWTQRGKPQSGDLIFTREAPVGEVGIVPDNADVLLGQRTVLIRPNTSKVTPEYLCFALQNHSIEWYADLKSQGSTVRHLNVSDLEDLPMFLPPISEQRNIVEELSLMDNRVTALKNNIHGEISLLDEKRNAMVTNAVTGQLDLTNWNTSEQQEISQ